MDVWEFLASGPEVSVEVSVNPVRKRLQLRQQRTRRAEIRTFHGIFRIGCRHRMSHSPALQARAFDHSATCPECCNRRKRNVLARQAEVRRLGGVSTVFGRPEGPSGRERRAHRIPIRRLVAREDGLRVLPASQRAQVRQRHVLQFRGELAPQRVEPGAGRHRHARERDRTKKPPAT